MLNKIVWGYVDDGGNFLSSVHDRKLYTIYTSGVTKTAGFSIFFVSILPAITSTHIRQWPQKPINESEVT